MIRRRRQLASTAPPALRAYCTTNARGEVVAADAALTTLRPASEDVSAPWTITEVLESPGLVPQIAEVAAGRQSRDVEAVLHSRHEAPQPVAVRLTPLHTPAGAPLVLVAIESPWGHASSTPAGAYLRDAVTGLPDRRAVAERGAAWRAAAAPAVPRFALLFLDLDDFKRINDSHGHAVGDAVLEAVASRWLHCIREGDLLARYGGDEFVLLIRDTSDPQEVEPVIERLRAAAAAPIVAGELTLQVSATVGWAAPRDPHWTIEALTAAADRDMYDRKARVLR
ncbi:MAG TPA: diguanylate cyclase [Lacipirellulaceae bacterium]|nr:diguanylate cyclase [Lacipirellulaceae bacterium]